MSQLMVYYRVFFRSKIPLLFTKRVILCGRNNRLTLQNSCLHLSALAYQEQPLSTITKAVINETIASIGEKDSEGTGEFYSRGLPHWVQTPVDFKLYNAKTLDDLLTVVEKFSFSGSQCVSFLARLCTFMPLEVENLQIDARFKIVCQTLINEIQFLSTGAIILALRSLLFLKVDQLNDAVECLRNAIIYLIRLDRVSPTVLVPFTGFHADFVDKDWPSSVNLQTKMEENIILHLSEINDVKLILLLLNKIQNRDPKWIRPVEMRAMDMIELMNMDDLVHLLHYVAAMRSRNVPLLKATCAKMCAISGVLNVKNVITVLMAINRLNFHDPILMTKICQDLSGEIDTISSRVIYQQLCTQIGNCRLRHEIVLNGLVDWTNKNYDVLKPLNLCFAFIMLARCNFLPNLPADMLTQLRDSITYDSVNDPLIWLDYVWSLSVLKLLNNDTASSVLNEEFCTSLLQGSAEFRQLMTKLKLMNVNAAAKFELENYDGPFLKPTTLETLPLQHSLTKHKLQAVNMFLDALTRAPAKYRLCDRISPQGYVIDAEMRMDKYARPLPVEKWTDRPDNEIKIAFLVWDYFDKTFVTTHLTGFNAMAVRHLQLSGYTVVEVNANELYRQKESLKRTMFLNKLIEEKVQLGNKLNELKNA